VFENQCFISNCIVFANSQFPSIIGNISLLSIKSLEESIDYQPALEGNSSAGGIVLRGGTSEKVAEDLESEENTFQEWKPKRKKLRELLFAIEIENFKFEELLTMSGEEILQGLAGDFMADLDELGTGLVEEFINNNAGYEELKAYVIDWFNKILIDRISTIYNFEEEDE